MSTLQVALICLILWKTTILAVARYDDLDLLEEELESGTATYTKEVNVSIITEGACGYGDLHKATYGTYGTGLTTMLFNKGSTCGACFEIRCVDHVRWCRPGSPSVVVTATDFCAPNYGRPSDFGGWCNFSKEHFEMSQAPFTKIANMKPNCNTGKSRRRRFIF